MTSPDHDIGFEQLGLGSILKQNQLIVPPYQREYRWEDDQVTLLLQDFTKAIGTGDYFLGTIVTIPQPGGHLEVVDGQQRLATTAILLAGMRDYLNDKVPMLVESLNNEFLTSIDRSKLSRVPNLKLNTDDNELFARIVTGDANPEEVAHPNRESHNLLLNARRAVARHITNIVSSLDIKDHGDLLNAWISFLEHNALVVLLRVPDHSNAYRMFETLNGRGIPTSQADLVKTYLFGRAGERFSEVQSRWAYMRGALETLGEEDITIDFLRHALIVMGGHVTEAKVYERVQEVARAEQSVMSVATTLETLANVYVATFNHDHERWSEYPNDARGALEVYNLLNIRPIRPLILAIAAKMDNKEATRAFHFIVSLSVRLLIAASTRTGSVEETLADSANKVFDGTITDASTLKQALSNITPSDSGFSDQFERARVSNEKLARYYLRSLERTAKEENEPYFILNEDSSEITLEHVLPKKPEGNWPQFSPDDADMYTTRLGNQALLRHTDNSQLKSKPFAEKRVVYAPSAYILTSQIGDLDDWVPSSIVDRQLKMAKLALKTWPL